MRRATQKTMFAQTWRLIVSRLIQQIPAEIEACEFECRQTQCAFDEWICCERRLRALRASQSRRTFPVEIPLEIAHSNARSR
jgi:hypothetical protein